MDDLKVPMRKMRRIPELFGELDYASRGFVIEKMHQAHSEKTNSENAPIELVESPR